jgi:mannan endo-1,4-beta-mannosidase
MDMYLSHITGNNTYHSDFYTDPRVIAAYESYVSAIVTRYASSAGIFAWELTNEARSGGYPSVARPGFSADDLTAWVAARSRFVKALDPHHMVAVGDEGYYNWANSTDYIYDGASGGDFEATLRLPSVDFGTLHLYPEAWSKTPTLGWGVEYIAQHAASMREIGKPVVFEEFNIDGYAQQQAVLPKWIDVAVAAGIPGIMPWGLGAQGLDISVRKRNAGCEGQWLLTTTRARASGLAAESTAWISTPTRPPCGPSSRSSARR